MKPMTMMMIGMKMIGPKVMLHAMYPRAFSIMSSVTCGFLRIASAARSTSASTAGCSAPRVAKTMRAIATVTTINGMNQLPRCRRRKTLAGEKMMSTKSSHNEAVGAAVATLGWDTYEGARDESGWG